MKIKYNYQDFLFVSSRIRAMETSLFKSETFIALAEARSISELYGILEDNGISCENGRFGEKSFEKGLKMLLDVAYLDVLASTPAPELFTVFTYPYDCINLKTSLKCAEKGISADGMLLHYGTVSPEAVAEAVLKRSFNVFPPNMANAAETAIAEFAKTRNPQVIDLLLDRALYLDMKKSVSENPVEFFHSLLKIKADTVNILTAVRIMRINGSVSLFESAYAHGGELTLSLFSGAFENGIETLAAALKGSRYERLSEIISRGEISLTELERAADKIYFDFIKTAKDIQAGAEVVAAYIAATEAQVRNIRILIAGKKLSVKPEELFERLSESYV